MAHATDSQEGGTGAAGIGLGWRVFQVVALLTALSWLGSYVLMYDPGSGIRSVLAGGTGLMEAWGNIVLDLSPILSIFIIALAVFPERLSYLTRGNDWTSIATRVLLFALPVLWMVNVFIGPRSVMIDKLISQPLNQSGMIPFFGGVFLHVVFQHWFQAIAALTLALVPEKFATLTESTAPAGVQCAVVECE
jgi:hypothetical protein